MSVPRRHRARHADDALQHALDVCAEVYRLIDAAARHRRAGRRPEAVEDLRTAATAARSANEAVKFCLVRETDAVREEAAKRAAS
ncbi:hypothetical protein G3I59_21085 [Amycolatopsis rubida]|uniref:Uncharacterized protein n=1 Tax=Amycolatopsis rubida TaxID=112413 RepID=A0ABX0BQW1_9PSEU|nr:MULTISPECIES: hypothetical protein [Amycolatopsis]MYW93040.1 hypothetical protein [Amycolatopsis rubida]NEC58027.1 hypothetical protein [Amycolatopsis rubida]OAP20954.1 hypothetical protein A4R44_08400 [Amycolatopsis sp. M39]